MTIKTEYYPKPIPSRKFDWDAWDIDDEENSPVGHGATEAEAIADFIIKIYENLTTTN